MNAVFPETEAESLTCSGNQSSLSQQQRGIVRLSALRFQGGERPPMFPVGNSVQSRLLPPTEANRSFELHDCFFLVLKKQSLIRFWLANPRSSRG